MRAQNTSSIGLFYKSVGMLWRVSDCEELVGVTQVAKYETLLLALIHKHIKNNRGAPKGGFAS